MSAIETLTGGLFDYAGLYPPASLSLPSAANNYLEYIAGNRSAALGRFIANADRLDEFREIAGDSIERFRLSVIANGAAELDAISGQLGKGMPIQAIEIKCSDPGEIEKIARHMPAGIEVYFEIPVDANGMRAATAVQSAKARAKLRMGGVVPDAFPSVTAVARMLKGLAELRLPFKATAGLHHPVRSRQPLTYQPQSLTGVMHGFMNVCCAAAMVFFGGDARDAQRVLEEEERSAWVATTEGIKWRDQSWTAGQLSAVRHEFLISIGSCSFEEPIRDMESLGWL